MRITGPGIWGPPADHDGAIAVLRRAVELGVDLIDTADSYGPTISEELIREALHPYGDVAGGDQGGTPAHRAGRAGTRAGGPSTCASSASCRCAASASRRSTSSSCTASTRPSTATSSSGCLPRCCSTRARSAPSGSRRCPSRSWTRRATSCAIATVQNAYNVTERGSEPVLERCASLGIGFIPCFPVAAGVLARPRPRRSATSRPQLGATTGAGLPRVAPAAQRRSMLPIPGTSSRRAPRGELRGRGPGARRRAASRRSTRLAAR